jgi:hypothetical protein
MIPQVVSRSSVKHRIVNSLNLPFRDELQSPDRSTRWLPIIESLLLGVRHILLVSFPIVFLIVQNSMGDDALWCLEFIPLYLILLCSCLLSLNLKRNKHAFAYFCLSVGLVFLSLHHDYHILDWYSDYSITEWLSGYYLVSLLWFISAVFWSSDAIKIFTSLVKNPSRDTDFQHIDLKIKNFIGIVLGVLSVLVPLKLQGEFESIPWCMAGILLSIVWCLSMISHFYEDFLKKAKAGTILDISSIVLTVAEVLSTICLMSFGMVISLKADEVIHSDNWFLMFIPIYFYAGIESAILCLYAYCRKSVENLSALNKILL